MVYSLKNTGKPGVEKVDTDFDYEGRQKVIEHLEEKYGKEKVAHIGTFSYLGVKSAIKDVGRVLRVSFKEVNQITKKLEQIIDKPGPKFKDYDKLKDSDDPNDRKKWEEFNELEQKYKEIFRLARRFEGVPRNQGVHASGILVTPIPISDIIPTRKANGTTVTIFTGEQLESMGLIKFDILGLKTLTVIRKTLEHINKELTFEDLYRTVDINDPNIFEMIKNKETDGLFQIESDLFKGMVADIQPESLNDIIAITSLGRPGPLQAGLPQSYARRKRGEEEAVEPLPNTWDVTKDSLGNIIYQEQVMLISQIVAGFDGNQADSYLRKALAKKDKEKMNLCRQWLIYGKKNENPPDDYDESNPDQVMYDPEGKYGKPIKGGINNGYDEEELKAFWKNLEGYADYLFNKSHASTYSYITLLTAYLKKYYPAEFMAALLSMEENEEKMEKYIEVAENMGIKIKAPDINKSGADFTPSKKSVLFGLGAIKGVGETSIPAIIENRPYSSLEEMLKKVPKKYFNKRVGRALIQAGAFDSFDKNRYKMLNLFHDLRKDKDERYDPDMYDRNACIEFEKEVLGAPITYKPWWNKVKPNQKVEKEMELLNVTERTDKNGRLMAFLTLRVDGIDINGIMFSSNYVKQIGVLDPKINKKLIVQGKKDEKGSIIVNRVSLPKEESEKSLADIVFSV